MGNQQLLAVRRSGSWRPSALRVSRVPFDVGFRTPEVLRFGNVSAARLAKSLAQGASGISTRDSQGRTRHFPEQRRAKEPRAGLI